MAPVTEGILRQVAELDQLLSHSHASLHECERKIAEQEEQIRQLRYMLARAEAAAVEWMKRAESKGAA